MRYCQTCGEARAQVLVHEGDEAICSVCGHREPAPRRALFVVTGASAVGKTTVRSALAEELATDAAVFDSDTFTDAFTRAGDGGDIDWDALAEAWVEVAHGLARQGRDMVLLCSFDPPLIERLPNRSSLTGVHYLLLDCADAPREARLAARPPWRGPDAAGQQTWSRLLRAAIQTRIRTDLRTPAETVDAIAAWVRAGGHHASDPPVDPPAARPTRPRAKAVPRAPASVSGSGAAARTTTSSATRTAARSEPKKAATKATKAAASAKAASPRKAVSRKTAGTKAAKKAASARKAASRKAAGTKAAKKAPSARKAASKKASSPKKAVSRKAVSPRKAASKRASSPKKAVSRKTAGTKVAGPSTAVSKPVGAPGPPTQFASGPPDPA